MRGFWAVLAVVALGWAGVALAGEKLGPDGFPADWTEADFAPGEIAPVAKSAKPVESSKPLDFGDSGKPAGAVEAAGEDSGPLLAPKVVSPVVPKGKNPISWRIEEMPKAQLAPSGSAVFFLGGQGAGDPVIRTGAGAGHARMIVSGSGFAILPEEGAAVSATAAVSGSGVSKTLPALPKVEQDWGLGKLVWAKSKLAAKEPVRVVPVASPALRDGWRKLLLQDAVPPQDWDEQAWRARRAELAEQVGLYETGFGLWRGVGEDVKLLPGMAEPWVRAALLAGDKAPACKVARAKALAGESGSFWPAAVAVCAALDVQKGGGSAGNTSALALSLQVLPPEVAQADPVLLAALHAVKDGTKMPGGVRYSPLAGAVVAGFPALLDPKDAGALPDVALRRLRESTALPNPLRIAAGRALARQTGWMADGVGLVKLVSGGVVSHTTPDAAVLAYVAGKYGEVDPAIGPLVVAAGLRLGQADVAKVWMGRISATEPERLRSGVLLGALQGRVDPGLLKQWLAAQPLGSSKGAAEAQRVLLGLDALGLEVEDGVWSDFRAKSAPLAEDVDAVWQRMLSAAVSKKDVPQVLELVGEAVDGRPVAMLSSAVLAESAGALAKVGLRDIGVRLFLEGVVTGGQVSGGRVVREVEKGELGEKKGGIEVKKVAKPAAPVVKKPEKPVAKTSAKGRGGGISISVVDEGPKMPISAPEGMLLPPRSR